MHPSGHHHAGEEEAEAEVLFSPAFHALQGHPPCAPGEGSGRAEETSTDGSDSTGTSATLGGSGEDSLGGGTSSSGEARVSAGSARGPASPLPLAAHAADASISVEPAIPEEEEEDSYLDFDPFVFIKRLPPVEQCVPARREFLLPRQTRRTKRKTLVLDLDETLVSQGRQGQVALCRSWGERLHGSWRAALEQAGRTDRARALSEPRAGPGVLAGRKRQGRRGGRSGSGAV